MRVTLNIDDELYHRIKRRKADSGQTITSLVDDALRMYFLRSEEASGPDGDTPVFHGSGILPGIDPYSFGTLLDGTDDPD